MTIDLMAVRRALKDAAQDADRARVFVRSDKFDVPFDARPEQRLMDVLRGDPRARVTVRGHAGSGKTSLIVHVLGHLPAFRRQSPAHVVVRLQVGGNPESFASADALQHAVLDGILAAAESPDEQFHALTYGIDLSAISEVVANVKNVTQPAVDSSLEVAIRPPGTTVGLVRTLKGEVTSLQTSATPRARFEALKRVVHCPEGLRPRAATRGGEGRRAGRQAGARRALIVPAREADATVIQPAATGSTGSRPRPRRSTPRGPNR